MKLSMWILAERFSSYDIRFDIRGVGAEISGVRFISEELNDLSPAYVYIGKCSDVFSDPDYDNTVVLVHGHDLMFIEDQSAEDILNETLAAFDFYNSWENSLWAAAVETSPVQSMIDVSQEIMKGPIGVTDASGHIIAYTKDKELRPQNEGWRFVAETGLVPNTYTSSQMHDESGALLKDWPTHPQIIKMEGNTCIGSQLVAGEEIVGAFYLEQFQKELTQGDVHLAAVFCEVLASLSAMLGAGTEVKTSTAIVGSLLNGEEPQEAALMQLDKYFDKEQPYQLLAIRSVTSSVNIVRKNTLLETIKSLVKDSLSLVYEDDIVCIMQGSAVEPFLQSLGTHIKLPHYAIGMSLPFDSWAKSHSRYKQAQFILDLANNVAGIYACQDLALAGLLAEVRKLDDTLDLTHPALATLREYDLKNSTELYLSLECYLNNERNMVKTAEELCIHRNSMKYRMRRIRELIDADLDNPQERLYLLLSFYLKE